MRQAPVVVFLAVGFIAGIALNGCGKEGAEGTAPLDCGAHGAVHDGHCHCDPGYLFDGTSCVAPQAVTESCVEEVAASDAGEEHHDQACRCPAQGECPCNHGTVQTFAAVQYCVPELHHE